MLHEILDRCTFAKTARYVFATVGTRWVYTLELPDGNRTTDAQINALSIAQRRVVITKDADFIATLLLNKQPHKLLLVGTGNISNNELLLLFSKNIGGIATALDASDYVELTPSAIVQH